MIYLAFVLGFVAASVFWTLAYNWLADKVKTLELKVGREVELRNEALKAVRRYEAKNAWLTYELERRDRAQAGIGEIAGTL